MNIKHFKTVFFVIAVALIISAVLSLLLSSFLFSSDIPDTVKIILNVLNFAVPLGGILSMLIFISYRYRRIKTTK